MFQKKIKDTAETVKNKVDEADLQNKFKEAADTVKNKVDEADLQNKFKNAADTVRTKVEDANLKEKFQGTVEAVKEKAGEVKLPDVDLFNKEDDHAKELPDQTDIKVISTKNAIKIIYYLMAVNGEIAAEEEEKLDSIGKELDPSFEENRDQIIDECKVQMQRVIDSEDAYDVIEEGVSEAISTSKATDDSFITPKILVWDLLTVAYSDNNYDEIERRLIKSVVRQLNVDKTEFLELENSYLTLVDIEKETEWIKNTDRPYKEIEAVVNELADRKSVIMESVKDLITL